LTTSITAYTKEEQDVAAKVSYKELSHAVRKLSKDNIELHKDLANLKGYLDGVSRHDPFVGFGRGGGGDFASEEAIEEFEPEPAARRTDKKSPEMSATPQQYEPPPLEALLK